MCHSKLSCYLFLLNIVLTLGRTVNVNVLAPWNHGYSNKLAFTSELSEFLFDISPTLFWSFTDNICNYNNQDTKEFEDEDNTSNLSDEDIQVSVYDIGASLIPQSMQSLMYTMIGLGHYSPTIQFFDSLASRYYSAVQYPCGEGVAFIVLSPGEIIVCNQEDLVKHYNGIAANGYDNALNSSIYKHQDWEHIHQSQRSSVDRYEYSEFLGKFKPSHNKDIIVVTLYGMIGSPSFCSLHHVLTAASNHGLFKEYAIRHSLVQNTATSSSQSGIIKTMPLQGYGIFLDIKNMEYKNVDDSKEKEAEDISSLDKQQQEDVIDFSNTEEILGLNFSILYKNLPQLGSELISLKEELLKLQTETDDQSSALKVWKMHDLGLQTLEIIRLVALSDTVYDAMNKFTEIVQNFPRVASKVSSTKVSSTVRNDLSRYLESSMHYQAPVNAMFINGKRIDLSASTFNIFDLFADIRGELQTLSKLSSLPLNKEVKKQISSIASNINQNKISTSSSSSSSTVRIDVSRGGKYVVNFLNNLEKDPMYRGMPRSLKQLLLPSWQLVSVARNLYTLIALIDLFSENGASLLMQIYMLMQQQYPVRIGLVFSCSGSSSNEVEGSSSINEDFCRLYAYLKKEYSNDDATNFALAIASGLMEGLQSGALFGMMTRIELISIFDSVRENSYKVESTPTSGTTVITKQLHSDFISNCSAYIEARGLPLNSYSLNGMVNTEGHLSNSLMHLLSKEQQHVTQLYRSKIITDKTKSLFSVILENAGAFSRYHPMLDEKSPEYIDFLTSEGVDLLENLDFIDLSFSNEDEHSELIIPNTAIIYSPVTSEGFLVIHEALQWLQTSQALGHRLAIIFQAQEDNDTDLLSLCTENNTCPAKDTNSLAHTTRSLYLIQKYLSDKYTFNTQSSYNCGTFCVKILTKVYAFLASSKGLITAELYKIMRDSANSELEKSNIEIVLEALNRIETESITQMKLLSSLGKSVFKKTVVTDSSSVEPQHVSSLQELPMIVYNGRLLQMISKETIIHQDDFILLANLEKNRISEQVSTITQDLFHKNVSITNNTSNNEFFFQIYRYYSELMIKISSYCGYYSSRTTKRFDVNSIIESISQESPSMVYTLEPPATSFAPVMDELQIFFIIDPLSLAGQRASSLIHLFREHLQYTQTIVFVPKIDITEFPLQNFYRFVASPSLNDVTNAVARFTQLPLQHTLTVRVDIPEPWNVQAYSALQDIDNLRCSPMICGDIVKSSDHNSSSSSSSSTKRDVTSISYALKNILVAGQCFEASRVDSLSSSSRYNSPPNGLQLTLSPEEMVVDIQSDTLVMQNLGYFQLKANPGLFRLGLAKGRASDLFEMQTEEKSIIAVRTYEDTIHRIKVLKKRGMESISLLEDQDETDLEKRKNSNTGIWNSISSLLSSKTVVSEEAEDDRIHVFSLATGHMYERLLRIMMLSVVRHTSKPVKFWLFENYLSPTFKQTATMMMEEYGFEVGYVTYKWPQWLTPQTQQQRIIWGYKILFLDVLFPLNVKKVIYVDADQVVRADLKELWEMDLQGKPYAYTPFCTSRKETLGFQFWQNGYWKDHLRGKPYHISALYVVDLQRFRRNAVGDTLRATYDQLSRDPNSLANLDQDLPNFAQHQVPIFSLPQEWLWCETWCSDKSKKDLCNNPLHKEPKLDMARRVIAGKLFNQSWIELDEEINNLQIKKGVTALSHE